MTRGGGGIGGDVDQEACRQWGEGGGGGRRPVPSDRQQRQWQRSRPVKTREMRRMQFMVKEAAPAVSEATVTAMLRAPMAQLRGGRVGGRGWVGRGGAA